MSFEELKIKIKSGWEKVNFFNWSFDFLLRKNRIFLVIFSLIILGYCACLWHNYLYQPEWSESKKQAYIESRQEEEVAFNRNSFDKVMAEKESRRNYFQRPVENVPDIFSLK